MLSYNCFLCNGMKKICVDENRFSPSGDEGKCIYRAIADVDLSNHKKGLDLEITLKEMLEEFLKNK